MFELKTDIGQPKLRLNVEASGKDCVAVCHELTAFLQGQMK